MSWWNLPILSRVMVQRLLPVGGGDSRCGWYQSVELVINSMNNHMLPAVKITEKRQEMKGMK